MARAVPRHALVGLLLTSTLNAGCPLLLPPPDDDVVIKCGETADCPAGYNCVEVGLPDAEAIASVCIEADDADTVPPSLVLRSVTPAVAGADDVVHFDLDVNELSGLYVPPALFAISPDRTTSWRATLTDERDGVTPFAYTLHVSSDDGDVLDEGLYSVEGVAADVAANATGRVTLGSFTVDVTPPMLVQTVALEPAAASGNSVVSLALAFNEPVRKLAGATLVGRLYDEVGGLLNTVVLDEQPSDQRLEDAVSVVSFAGSLPGMLGEGTMRFTVQGLVDRAGNPSGEVEVTDAALTVDAEAPVLTGGLLVQGDRFSAQPGHNQIVLSTVIEEDAERVWVNTSDGAPGLDTSDCGRDDVPAGAYSCVVVVEDRPQDPPGTPPTSVLLYLRARDAAGNEANEGRDVVLDFAPPAVVPSSVQIDLEAADESLIDEPTAAGAGGFVEIAFLLDEPTSEDPEVTIETPGQTLLALEREQAVGLSYLYAAVVGDAGQQPEGEGALQIVTVDDVGNRAVHSAALTLPDDDDAVALTEIPPVTVDVTPPSPPRVQLKDAVVFHRMPWGGGDEAGARFWVEGLEVDGVPPVDVPAGEAVIVRVLAGRVGNGELGRTTTTDGTFGGDAAVSLLPLDRAEVYVQSVDGAGNPSERVLVRDVRWFAAMGGKIAGVALDNPHIFSARSWDTGALGQAGDVEVGALAGPAPGNPLVLRTEASPQWEQRAVDVPVGEGPWSSVAYVPTDGTVAGWFATDSAMAGALDYTFHSTSWQTSTPAIGATGYAPPPGVDLVWASRWERLVLITDDATWLRGPSGWEEVATVASDPLHPTYGCGIAYHPVLDRVVTWQDDQLLAFDGEQWSAPALPGATPPNRTACGLAYDSRRERLVVFGGQGGGPRYDVWELDLEQGWLDAGNHPPPAGPINLVAAGFGPVPVAYDAEAGRMWVVANDWMTGGGFGDEEPVTYVLWEWTGEGWLRLQTFTSAFVGVAPAIAFRGAGELFFAGAHWMHWLSSTANYDNVTRRVTESTARALNSWEPLGPRRGVLAAPNAAGGATWWGGSIEQLFGDAIFVEEYVDTGNLQALSFATLDDGAGEGTTSPSRRDGARLVFDAGRGVQVLHGGSPGGPDDQVTWAFDGSAWTQEHPGPADNIVAPVLRNDAGLAYDAGRGEVILFGGSVGGTVYGDTWAYDGATWTLLVEADANGQQAPQPRRGAYLVYDSARARLVLFGGDGSASGTSAPLNDTWVFEGGAWAPLESPQTPPARRQGLMAFNPADGRTYLLTGVDANGASLSDVWSFNGVAWKRESVISMLGEPVAGPRRLASMAYLGEEEALALWGGEDDGLAAAYDDLWTLRGPNRARPAHVMEVLFSAAGSGRDAVVREVEVGGVVGGSGSWGPDCVEAAGADVDVWRLDRWERVATVTADAAAPSVFGASVVGTQNTGDVIATATGRRLFVRVRPSTDSGCAQARGTVATDTLQVAVRYTLPADTCGDGVVDEGEACDGDAACGQLCRPIACGDAVVEGDEACDDGNLVDGDGCSSACLLESPFPAPGDLLISEIMAAPVASDDADGEWFEVVNLSARTLDLFGVEISAGAGNGLTIGRHTFIAPGEVAVIGRSSDRALNGDVHVDLALTGGAWSALDDAGGELVLARDGVELDRMPYPAASPGVAVQVRPGLLVPGAPLAVNDLAAAMCAAPHRFGAGDFGSPGRLNPACP